MSEAIEKVTISVMGRPYSVPVSVTILQAMEFAGYKLVRGVGCRGGVCGACSCTYRLKGDSKLYSGLACQTVVEEGMELTQLPFYPAQKAQYNIREMGSDGAVLRALYPELSRCMGCNSCTNICPQDLEVMEYISAALRGDVARVAQLSFECILCRLCVTRCPADEVQPNVAILARRIYGSHILPRAPHVIKRVAEIKDGKFDKELDAYDKKDKAELTELYKARDIEPQ